MKKTLKDYFLRSFLLLSLFAFTFASCSDDDTKKPTNPEPENPDPKDPETTDPEETKTYYAFILNEGDNGGNNALLSFYDISKDKFTSDYFGAQNNGKKLGSLAQDILIYDSKVFITINQSNIIYVTDLEGKVLKEITISKENDGYYEPRYIVEHDGYIYIDFYSGHVIKLNPNSYEVEGKLEIPVYSEQMAVANGQLYITNSYRTDFATGSVIAEGKTITVIDLSTFTEKEKISVHLNPSKIVSDKAGNIYFLSMGNYTNIPNTLSVIKNGTNIAEIIKEGNIASVMAIDEITNRLLFAYQDWSTGSAVSTYSQYDITSKTFIEESFISTDDATIKKFVNDTYYMSIHPENGDIYISTASYGVTGNILVFDKEGKFKTKFSSEGYYTQKVAFFTKETEKAE